MNTEKKAPPPADIPHSIEHAVLDRARMVIRQHSYDLGSWPTPSPDRQQMLQQISRSTQIVGRVLDGISHDQAAVRRPSRFLIGIGRVLWTVVELSTRNSLPGIAARYWLSLLLFAETLLLVASYVLSSVEVRSLAWELLAITFGCAALIELIRIWFDRASPVRRIMAIPAALIILGIIVLAAFGWPVAMQQLSRLITRETAVLRSLFSPSELTRVQIGFVVMAIAFASGYLVRRLRTPQNEDQSRQKT